MFKSLSPATRLGLLLVGVLLACLLFMTLNVRAGWAFTLPFRGEKLLGLLLVAYCIAVSTVLFQTITHNRILSPGIMGFDFLYLLLQSLMVYSLGSIFFSQINPSLKWLGEVFIMVGAMCLLYYWLFIRQQRHLHILVLVGIILGTLFRSLNAMIARLMDPVEFDLLQDVMFASFNQIDSTLLGVSAFLALLVTLFGWRYRHALDVLALGNDQAVNLGLNPRRLMMLILIAIAVLVSVSTALVGPVTFFGLLVANLAYQLAGTHRHVYVVPMAVGLAAMILIAGQAVLEHVLSFATGLSVIIEFIGGLFFLILVIRQGRR
ncbi:MAG: iron chelate uptake ABC transporter family permease subunit [Nitrincola lacisaponensis]|uniref:Iron compound ABC uptake transporter permease protein PiuC n=1 Tax=Nitrincola lacisaponensis TaxID=267850 RepID=A0A063Y6G5_9GAMM|nr:iron chelate uptake ABC transporter family permease subunit [Nitrincola lacisaponensis]KDE40002.1 Iron compound ABC uptake transporter permease protein PiuC [Nitrincola lacisaponensis]